LKVLPGAGHACQIEQPWFFDRFMIEFLTEHGLFAAAPSPAKAVVRCEQSSSMMMARIKGV